MFLSSDVFVLTVSSLYGQIMLIFQLSSIHLCPVVSKKKKRANRRRLGHYCVLELFKICGSLPNERYIPCAHEIRRWRGWLATIFQAFATIVSEMYKASVILGWR